MNNPWLELAAIDDLLAQQKNKPPLFGKRSNYSSAVAMGIKLFKGKGFNLNDGDWWYVLGSEKMVESLKKSSIYRSTNDVPIHGEIRCMGWLEQPGQFDLHVYCLPGFPDDLTMMANQGPWNTTGAQSQFFQVAEDMRLENPF